MKPEHIVIPYSKVKDLKFESRLILEIDFQERLKESIIERSGIDNLKYYTEGEINITKYDKKYRTNYIMNNNSFESGFKEGFFIRFSTVKESKIYDKSLEYLLLRKKNYVINKALTIAEKSIFCIYSLVLDFPSSVIRDKVYNDQDYIFLLSERFMEWVGQDEIKHKKAEKLKLKEKGV